MISLVGDRILDVLKGVQAVCAGIVRPVMHVCREHTHLSKNPHLATHVRQDRLQVDYLDMAVCTTNQSLHSLSEEYAVSVHHYFD